MSCPACGSEVPGAARFCPACGSAVDFGSTPTLGLEAAPRSPDPQPASPRKRDSSPSGRISSSSDSFDGARFTPGTILAERYRIVSMAGRGGMGEVYRADDLKLGQPVALKFLPEATAQDAAAWRASTAKCASRARFRIPTSAGSTISAKPTAPRSLSMEYVDGEDLASLLRRIGRLPADKALEIARQLCAGLAAAHDKGVLHRDLKPANVMIDGRGQVLHHRFRPGRRRRQLEGGGHPRRHAGLHGARATGRQRSLGAQRHLRAGAGAATRCSPASGPLKPPRSDRATPAPPTNPPVGEGHRSTGRARDPALSGRRPAQAPRIGAGSGGGVAGRRSAGRCAGGRGYAHARHGGRVRRYRRDFGAHGRHLSGLDSGGIGGGGDPGREGQCAPEDSLPQLTRDPGAESARDDPELRIRRPSRRPRLRV